MGSINKLFDPPLQCKIKEGYLDSGKSGVVFALVCIRDRYWALVQFEDDEDPDIYKAESISVIERVEITKPLISWST